MNKQTRRIYFKSYIPIAVTDRTYRPELGFIVPPSSGPVPEISQPLLNNSLFYYYAGPYTYWLSNQSAFTSNLSGVKGFVRYRNTPQTGYYSIFQVLASYSPTFQASAKPDCMWVDYLGLFAIFSCTQPTYVRWASITDGGTATGTTTISQRGCYFWYFGSSPYTLYKIGLPSMQNTGDPNWQPQLQAIAPPSGFNGSMSGAYSAKVALTRSVTGGVSIPTVTTPIATASNQILRLTVPANVVSAAQNNSADIRVYFTRAGQGSVGPWYVLTDIGLNSVINGSPLFQANNNLKFKCNGPVGGGYQIDFEFSDAALLPTTPRDAAFPPPSDAMFMLPLGNMLVAIGGDGGVSVHASTPNYPEEFPPTNKLILPISNDSIKAAGYLTSDIILIGTNRSLWAVYVPQTVTPSNTPIAVKALATGMGCASPYQMCSSVNGAYVWNPRGLIHIDSEGKIEYEAEEISSYVGALPVEEIATDDKGLLYMMTYSGDPTNRPNALYVYNPQTKVFGAPIRHNQNASMVDSFNSDYKTALQNYLTIWAQSGEMHALYNCPGGSGWKLGELYFYTWVGRQYSAYNNTGSVGSFTARSMVVGDDGRLKTLRSIKFYEERTQNVTPSSYTPTRTISIYINGQTTPAFTTTYNVDRTKIGKVESAYIRLNIPGVRTYQVEVSGTDELTRLLYAEVEETVHEGYYQQ